MYLVSDVAKLFGCAKETARGWAIEFAESLSPGANPGEGRQRTFTDSDLEVLALVAEMKAQGKLYSDIHNTLLNGGRGKVPDGVNALVSADTLRPTQLQARVNFLELELKAALASRDADKAQIDLLTRQLDAAQDKIDKLNRQIGRLERDMD